MRNRFGKTAAGSVLVLGCLAGSASAQTPAAPPATGSSAVANPTYVNIPMEIDVNRPVAAVWTRVGKWCDVSEWLNFLNVAPCRVVSGKDGELGSVRSVGNEILVGKSEYSYTYTQAVRAGVPYNLYHGTLEARATSPTTTKLLYTIVLDNSMLPDDAARQKDIERRRDTFTRGLQNMKILAEGGTLPPPPARGASPAAPPAGR